MREVKHGGPTVHGAFQKLYEEARKNKEILYMKVNGNVFMVFPEDSLRFPVMKNVEDSALKDEADKRGFEMIPKKDIDVDYLYDEELKDIIRKQQYELEVWAKNKKKISKK